MKGLLFEVKILGMLAGIVTALYLQWIVLGTR